MNHKNKHICMLLLITSVCMVLLYSCEIINPDEVTPSYIHIDRIDVQSNYATQGSNSNSIVDAWVFVNDQIIGGFELPATIPVLASGKANIKIRGGIRNSGSEGLRREYPFYGFFEQNTTLYPDSIIDIKPIVSYYESAKFEFIEDFEGSTYYFSPSTESVPISITNNPTEVIEGTGSLKISLNDSSDVFYATSGNYYLPGGGKEVYIEMDYKSTGYIELRLIANYTTSTSESSIIIIYPTAVKKKIYVDIGPIVSSASSAVSFKLALLAYNGSSQVASTQIIDNIKLIDAGN